MSVKKADPNMSIIVIVMKNRVGPFSTGINNSEGRYIHQWHSKKIRVVLTRYLYIERENSLEPVRFASHLRAYFTG